MNVRDDGRRKKDENSVNVKMIKYKLKITFKINSGSNVTRKEERNQCLLQMRKTKSNGMGKICICKHSILKKISYKSTKTKFAKKCQQIKNVTKYNVYIGLSKNKHEQIEKEKSIESI